MTDRFVENPFNYNAQELAQTAAQVRRNIITMNSAAGAGHTGADLSQTDILVTLYFAAMRYDTELCDPNRDRFILSKGHGAGGFYCTLAEAGLIPREALSSYLQFDSPLPGHPVKQKTRPVEVNTGALGHGLSIAVGLALAARKSGRQYRVFVLVGDGELQEGSNWEAMMSASAFGLDNLVIILDRNRLQLADRTEKIMRLEPLEEKLRAFGLRVEKADGNDPADLLSHLKINFPNSEQSGHRGAHPNADSAPVAASAPHVSNAASAPISDSAAGAPLALLAHTIKGKGVSFIENNPAWHHRIPKGNEVQRAIEELE